MDLAAIHERVKALQQEIRELRTDNGEKVRQVRELRLQQILHELAQLMQTATSIKERGSTRASKEAGKFGRNGDSGRRK